MSRRMNLQGNIEMEKYRSAQTSKKTWRYRHVEYRNVEIEIQKYRIIEMQEH